MYLGIEYNLMDISSQGKLEGILKKTIRALEAEATPKERKEVFAEYISTWHPDKSYG